MSAGYQPKPGPSGPLQHPPRNPGGPAPIPTGFVFCTACGEKLVPEKTGGFDPFTGQPSARLVCPSGKCGHHNTPHVTVIKGLFNPRNVCVRCGQTMPRGIAPWPINV